jgi:hypothetical protein
MFEGQLPRVETEWWGGQGQRLGVAELPEVNSDLIRASGPRERFEERGAISEPLQHRELGTRAQPIGFIHVTRSQVSRFFADRRLADEVIDGRMSLDSREVSLLHFTASELRLHQAGKGSSAGEHDQPGGVGIEPMSRSRLLRTVSQLNQVLESIPIEASAGMQR